MRPVKSDSFSGVVNEQRVASTAGGGTALSTTAAFIALPNGTQHVALLPRNFVTAIVAKIATNPYLLLLKTTDALATTANVTDYSKAGQQNPATASAISFNAFGAANNQFYVGSHVPFRGVNVVMSASVNAVASVLTVKYWNGAWTAVSGFSDGTLSGGATLAVNGNITWTVPTDWTTVLLNQTPGPLPQMKYSDKVRYWTQWTVSAQLSATVGVNTMLAMNRNTSAYAEFVANTLEQFRTFKGPDGVGCLEALTDQGTGNLIVNVYTDNPQGVF